jgi:hypothetical protein
MTKINPNDRKLYFPRGVASRFVNGQKIPVEEIVYNDPNCGYYVDPRGFLVLPNFNSVSGDIDDKRAVYLVDGVVTVGVLSAVEDIVCGFKNNAVISSPSPTPSVTKTPTVTPTSSITPTVTPTSSVTPTVTPSISITSSVTPTISVTSSISATASVTPSVTSTVTPSVTPSITPTVTPSASPA